MRVRPEPAPAIPSSGAANLKSELFRGAAARRQAIADIEGVDEKAKRDAGSVAVADLL